MNSDGGSWIKAGMKQIAGITHVLDEFHLEKYLTKLTSHMKDSREDAAEELRSAIRSKTKKDFEEIIDRLEGCLNEDTGLKRMENAREYILSNWSAAKLRLKHKDGVKGSSTEGHVSHVLSARMSSRPLGWSKVGADKMSRLRIYDANGGDMLELVRYQKQVLPKAVGCEEICSSAKMFAEERKQKRELGILADIHLYEIPYPQIKKMAALKNQIWGL